MGNIKKLAGQTIWYGVPTIVHRFLGFVLQLFLTGLMPADEYGVVTQIYAVIPFLNIVFTYGLETSFFRFVQHTDKSRLYNTLCVSMLVSTTVFTALLLAGTGQVADLLRIRGHETLITLTAGIVFFDTLATLPFAMLRQEGRPRKYALVKVLTIVTQIGLSIFFLIVCPWLAQKGMVSWYNPAFNVGYFVLSNLLASAMALLFLYKELTVFRWVFDKVLWKEVMRYSLPLLIVGFGGMINEMLSRLVFAQVYPYPKEETDTQLGIFGAVYKLTALVTIFINVFRMGAEPFFFNQSRNEDAQLTYARVLKFFAMALGAVFLVVSLFLDLWGLFITLGKDKRYAEGLHIVPILTMGTVFVGIYYNLTVWYKLTNRNMTGAYITLAGALITIVLNILWIPEYGYTGSAWATFICYAFMMVSSYLLGQKYYPVPYDVGRILFYLGLAGLIYIAHAWVRSLHPGMITVHACGVAGLAIYMAVILLVERREVAALLSRKPR
ncbi:polysaccharide biosynthesis protein [Chitinophaga alhagiae]|uniref:Polysaccharide biosynthesis protein n=1 Tax=Chitinophaga alhagiae TaxID=2203219 RepID=A0ABM6WCX1_9BACT|nr:oligosaccharide flippase family protein [Chitinophaga alhagiae]AWO01770.1 polysaccharide biosynthesis protein [Chitinophaga alhagiae]